MSSLKPIGGYFELELPKFELYHQDAIALNTGRNCLEYILRVRDYRHVYIPYYTCDVILEPLNKLGIRYSFYHIDKNLELAEDVVLKSDEALLATNYFGLKREHMLRLAAIYGKQLIIDNTQAFFDRAIDGIDTFYSCRKFFGVPDGAYLYCNRALETEIEQDESWMRCSHLLKRIDLGASNGYLDFRSNDDSLSKQEIKKMSQLTKRLMESVDYEKVSKCRIANFKLMQEAFDKSNEIHLSLKEDTVPMVYPYVSLDKKLRDRLIENEIFVAHYWPNVLEWLTDNCDEAMLFKYMLPLPIDQRYNAITMNVMINKIKKYEH